MADLKPCPCGVTSVDLLWSELIDPYNHRWVVTCGACNSWGVVFLKPLDETVKASAQAAWNAAPRAES